MTKSLNRISRSILAERFGQWWKIDKDKLDELMQEINNIPANNHAEIMIKKGMFFRVLKVKQNLLSKNK